MTLGKVTGLVLLARSSDTKAFSKCEVEFARLASSIIAPVIETPKAKKQGAPPPKVASYPVEGKSKGTVGRGQSNRSSGRKQQLVHGLARQRA